MHSVKFKARHAARSFDGKGPAPWSLFRQTSRQSRVPNDIEQGNGVIGGNNHSETCLEPTDEQQRHTKSQEANKEFGRPQHASTMPPESLTTEEGSTTNFGTPNYQMDVRRGEQSSGTSDTLTDGNVTSREKGPRRRKGILGKLGMKEKASHDASDSDSESEKSGPAAWRKKHYPVGAQIKHVLFENWLNILLVCSPIGIALKASNQNAIAVFVVNFIAIIPLAGILSGATEQLALYTGETLGGLLNASFGNAVELIVSIQALVQGKIIITKTSLIGSILSNLLLVLGMSFFFGGVNRVEQHFNVTVAQTAASLLALSVGSLIVPTVFRDWTPIAADQEEDLQNKTEAVSRGTSIILLLVYGCYLFFQLSSHKAMYNEPSKKVQKRKNKLSKKVRQGSAHRAIVNSGPGLAASTGGAIHEERHAQDPEEPPEEPELSILGAFIALAISTALVAVNSEFMVDGIDAVTGPGSPVTETFVGLILIPIVGNAAEHATAVTVAIKDKMDLAIGVAVGSSMQIALLVLPLIDVIGWITQSADCNGDEMSLAFDGFQLALMFVAVLLVNYLIQDGKSHWLEGVLLMSTYIIIAVAAWFYPTTEDCSKSS